MLIHFELDYKISDNWQHPCWLHQDEAPRRYHYQNCWEFQVITVSIKIRFKEFKYVNEGYIIVGLQF